MAELLTGLLASNLGTFAAGSLGLSMVLWALGKFRTTAAYKSMREAWGKLAEGLGATVSRIGNTRLKAAWEPIEDLLCDFLIFFAEQFAVGLRKDNPVKMEKQLERLEEVDSKSRARAMAEKLDMLRHKVAPMQHPQAGAMFNRLNQSGIDSIGDKLNQ